MTSNIKHTKFESNPEWNTITVEQKFSTWTIGSHSDGDIEIECSTNNGSDHLFLNQTELKEFIEFLQSKITK
jgi:hypothetical protein